MRSYEQASDLLAIETAGSLCSGSGGSRLVLLTVHDRHSFSLHPAQRHHPNVQPEQRVELCRLLWVRRRDLPITSAWRCSTPAQTRVRVHTHGPSGGWLGSQKSDFPVRVSKEQAFGFGCLAPLVEGKVSKEQKSHSVLAVA